MAEYYDPTSTRLIGGLKAPGGSISQAWSDGVNNRIGQRDTLQAMRERAAQEQRAATEFQWKGEDRARALREAEAAKARAAAAAARNRALNAALAAGVKIPDAPFSAIPAPTGRLPTPVDRPPASPRLGFGSAGSSVSAPPPMVGGGGSTALQGGSGADRLGAPPTNKTADTRRTGKRADSNRRDTPVAAPQGGPAFEARGRGGSPSVSGPMGYEQFVAAARAGQQPTWDQLVAAVEAGSLTTQQAADVQAMIESGYVPSEADVRAATAPGQTPTQSYPRNPNSVPALVAGGVSDFVAGTFGGRTIGEQAAIDAERARAAAEFDQFYNADTAAGGQTGSSTSQPGEAAAAVAPARTSGPIQIQMPDGSVQEFSLGATEEDLASTVEPAQLSFGPKLGAAWNDPSLSVASKIMAIPPGEAAPPARVEQYVMEPQRVGAEMQEALSVREELVRQANVFQQFGDTGRYLDTVDKINQLDDQLVDLQTAQGLIDLQFNSPQRIEAALSYKTGWDIKVQPNSVGTFDVFANGQLWDRMDRNQLGAFAQSLLDEGYQAKMAEREDERFKTQLEIEKIMAQEAVKTEYGMVLEGLKADLTTREILLRSQLDPSNVELVKSETDGMIHIYDKVAGQYVGYIDSAATDPITGEPLTEPVMKPYAQ